MDPLYQQRTTHSKPGSVASSWVLIDASDKTPGRLASAIATRLMGKDKPEYQPGVITGSSVVVINTAKMKITGQKLDQKKYYQHSGYMGGMRVRTMRQQMNLASEKVVLHALKGMLPKNKHGRKLLTRVRLFEGQEHNMQAQQPQPVNI